MKLAPAVALGSQVNGCKRVPRVHLGQHSRLLAAPFGNVNYLLDTTVIVMAFIVVVIGGLGNLYGALVAALAVGVLKGVGVLYFPRLSMVLIFLIMASVLVLRSMGRAVVSK